MNPGNHRIACLAVLAALGMLGCSRGTDGPRAGGKPGPILVLVAASTQEAVREVAAGFTRDTGVAVRLNADDTSKLAAQIVNGAPADLFLSANEKWADFIEDKGFALEKTPLLGNTLVLVVPRGNPARISRPEDLTLPAVRKVALAGPTVPAGIYARQALKHLHMLGELEKQKKIVAGESVRVTLAYVERGEVEAGVVYGTEAKITDQVEVAATFAPTTHDPIVYPLLLLKAAEKNPAARQFRDRLTGPGAASVFQKYGFTRLTED